MSYKLSDRTLSLYLQDTICRREFPTNVGVYLPNRTSSLLRRP